MYKSIAIDGPAGAGKSTISKLLADKIGFNYLDTGAMYRAFTYFYLINNIDINNEDKINNNIKSIKLTFKDNSFYLNNKNINKEIRSDEVTKNVSLVSSYKKVREYLVSKQREIASKSNIILDGRDIGSFVLKDASIKFFLTATPEERAKRRLIQNKESIKNFEKVLLDINRRDNFDSTRKISPLKKADDAIIIDTTHLSIDDTINLLIKLLEEKNVI